MQTVCQAYDDILEVEVGEIFTVNGGSYSHIQAVLWDFDPAVFETVSVHEYSTRGKFKAISPSPSAGSVIQATIYYYKSGTTSSGVNKAVASWKVYVADDGSESTVSLPSSMSMQEGQTKTVKATTSSNKYSGKYKWTTSNHYIVDIIYDDDNEATLKAYSTGSTYIHVTLDNGNSDSMYVTVTSSDILVNRITLNKTSETLEKGETLELSATVSPSNATDKSVSWYSNDESVATVSRTTGKVTAVGVGTATITCKANDAGNAQATCKITVTSPDEFTVNGIRYKIATNKFVNVIALATGQYSGNITIPKTVTSNGKTYTVNQIGESAFKNCTGLNSIVLPEELMVIQKEAFYGCSGLSSLRLPSSVGTVYENAFENCTGLKSVYLNLIGFPGFYSNAFKSCSNIKSVYINNLSYWAGVSFKNGSSNPMWNGAAELYLNGEKVKNLVIPNDVETIKFAAFGQCTSIESVTVQEGTKYIKGRTFQNAVNLTTISLPSSLEEISGFAFGYCKNLKRVNCYATTPPDLAIGWDNYSFDEYWAFIECRSENVVLHVPTGAESAYRSATGWNRFGVIIGDLNPAGIDGVVVDEEEGPAEYFTIQGISAGTDSEALAPGLYIKRQGGKATKILVK